ncbi:MAG: CGGC domain-containing protein [Desulfobacterium sp.]|nr:CGGC domain-containing protein [Desulfobacterium sp.]
MKKIGILTCSNTTQDLGCSSFKCLDAIYENSGDFKKHESSGGAQLAGIINCAGCPTVVAPEKLLERVRSLAVLGVEAIHLSSCMIVLCPFKNKYAKLLENQFPDIEIVLGTHSGPEGEVQMFTGWAKEMLSHKPNPMADLAQHVLSGQSNA